MYCPECLSDEITQISEERVEYDIKNSKIIEVHYESEYQTYECRKCGHEFNNDDARTILTQINSVWKYLCKKFNWSDEDIDYKTFLRERTRKQWDDLFKHIWKEELGKGYIEWEWRLIFSTDIRSKTSNNAYTFIKEESEPFQSMSLDKVRWIADWDWVDTK